MRASAEFAAGLLLDAGFEHVDLLETAGAPAVYGDWLHAGGGRPDRGRLRAPRRAAGRSASMRGRRRPFEPVMVDGECRARGAIDDKGQTLYEIEAARGLLRGDGRLPVNLKFLIEGEEEVGSPHFEDLLVAADGPAGRATSSSCPTPA